MTRWLSLMSCPGPRLSLFPSMRVASSFKCLQCFQRPSICRELGHAQGRPEMPELAPGSSQWS